MSQLIACLGEILIDFLPIEEGGRTVGFRMHPGGSPFNVAVGLARLGAPTAFATKISSDFFGRYLREYLEAQDISTRFLVTSEAQTTLAFVAMERGEPAYAFYSEGTADTLLTAGELPDSLFSDTSILHFGSISLLNGTTPAAVLAAVERLKGRALISFDPNLRPGLIRDEAAYRALLERLVGLCDVLKFSASDLGWVAPGRSVEEVATHLAKRGPALVVVTRGGDGALAICGGERWDVPALPVQVVDTVGAGDAFTSGLLAGFAERGITSRAALESADRDSISEALRLGTVVSAITCTRAGSDPPTREVAAQLLAGPRNEPAKRQEQQA